MKSHTQGLHFTKLICCLDIGYSVYWLVKTKAVLFISPKPDKNIQQKSTGIVTQDYIYIYTHIHTYIHSSLALKIHPLSGMLLSYTLSKWEGSFFQILPLVAVVEDERQSSAFSGIATYFRCMFNFLAAFLTASSYFTWVHQAAYFQTPKRTPSSPPRQPFDFSQCGQPHSAGSKGAATVGIFSPQGTRKSTNLDKYFLERNTT